MANFKFKFSGVLEGYVPKFFEEPTYKNEPTDFRIKVKVDDPDGELLNILSEHYENSCSWYRKESGKKRFFDHPWIENEDGTITVRCTAKPCYEEHPFPVVDGDLEPIDENLILREGTRVLVSTVFMPYSLKSPQGGMRIRPRAIQVLEAITFDASDSGELDLEAEFGKSDGFKKTKPNVKKKTSKKSDNVPTEDDDF
tara:strand:+ start:317 stop:910 length:594 start_codon:yes stop_codon:yes gene_type:complete